jgi:polysaccharide pyruvyl transferase WcaK-like protein
MLALTHAFSRKNAGDGLLVDLSLALLDEAGVGGPHRLLCLDPHSFVDLASRHDVRLVPGEPRARPSFALVGASVELLRSTAAALPLTSRGGLVDDLLRTVDGIVAVGGGYLVADSLVRSGGVALNHLPQILAAGRRDVPSVFLPQSIGPLLGPVGLATRQALSRIDVVYARDDVTFRELQGVTDVRRCPDLAVLQLAHRLSSISRPQGGSAGDIIVVPRELPNAPGYHQRLLALGRALPRPRWAVQADVDGPRSDRRFLGVLGVPDAGNLGQLTASGTPGVVVSVRLHGAIASLLAGWPAIHLSYERKGWGAYQDLGLDEWVHDARSFDVDKVAAQAADLAHNPAPMFARIESRLPHLLGARTALVDELRRRFADR